MDEFEHCLRCGQPLRSWLSRHEGFGLHCWEALTPADRRRLVRAARALQADLDTLDRPTRHTPIRVRVGLWLLGLREHD